MYHPFQLKYWFGQIDSRPVAIYRILFSLILLKYAVYHFFIADWLYSDSGVLPRTVLLDIARSARFSLMDSVSTTAMVMAFFVIWVGVLGCLLMGYHSRLMAVLNFIIILSIHERNVYVVKGADTALRLMSFWLMFAPLAQYYSIDAVRRRWQHFRLSNDPQYLHPPTTPLTAFALPIRIMQWQIIIIYIVTALLKLMGDVWLDGTALFYVFQLDTWLLPMGRWLSDLGSLDVIRMLTYGALIIEVAIPVLIVLPFFQPFAKALALLAGFGLHIGIALMLAIPDFSLVMITAYLLFFEPKWLDFISRRIHPKPVQSDRILHVPQNSHHPAWILPLLLNKRVLQIEAPLVDVLSNNETADSWYIHDAAGEYSNQQAWDKAMRWMPFSWWLMKHAQWSVGWLGIWIQNLLQVWSTALTHTSPRSLQAELPRWFLVLILVPIWICVCLWNIQILSKSMIEHTQVSWDEPFQVPDMARKVILYSGLWQSWDLFAPNPIRRDGRFVIEGRFASDARINLLTGHSIEEELPPLLAGPAMRWVKFEEFVFRERPDAILRSWGAAYCRRYNADPTVQLQALQIRYHYVVFHDPGEAENEPQQHVLWTHWCFDEFRDLFD